MQEINNNILTVADLVDALTNFQSTKFDQNTAANIISHANDKSEKVTVIDSSDLSKILGFHSDECSLAFEGKELINLADLLTVAANMSRIEVENGSSILSCDEMKNIYVRSSNPEERFNPFAGHDPIVDDAIRQSINLGNGVFMLPPDFGMNKKPVKSKSTKKKASTKKPTKKNPTA